MKQNLKSRKFFKIFQRIIVVSVLLSLSLNFIVVAETFGPTKDIDTFSFNVQYNDIMNKYILEEVNACRAKAEVPPLKYDYILQDYADLRAAELQIKFSHERPNGKGPLEPIPIIHSGAGLSSWRWAENIAMTWATQPFSNSFEIYAKEIVDGWMNSPGHRKNILNPQHTHAAFSTSFSAAPIFLREDGNEDYDFFVYNSVQLFSGIRDSQDYDSHFNPETGFINQVRTENMVVDSGNGLISTEAIVNISDINADQKMINVFYKISPYDAEKEWMNPANISVDNRSLIFESSNPSKLTISPDGTINLLEDGVVNITIKTSKGVVVGVINITVTGHPAKPKPDEPAEPDEPDEPVVDPSKFLYGDANADGQVNMRDVVYLSRYLNKWAENKHIEIFENCDLNQDGMINMRDLVILSRHLNKWVEFQVLPVQE